MSAQPAAVPAVRYGRRPADIPRHSSVRWVAIPALFAAAVAHVPVIPFHLQEAPYIGALFIALAIACTALAVTLAVFDTPTAWDLTIWVCGLAVIAYILSRTVGLPQITDDIGNWTEPLGIVSIAAESLAVICGIVALRTPAAGGGRPTLLV